MAASFVAMWLHFGESVRASLWCLFVFFLVCIAAVDAKSRVIPDVFSLVLAGSGLVMSMIWAPKHLGSVWYMGLVWSLVGMAVGGGILLAVGMIGKVIKKKPVMGTGDMLFLGAIGAWLGAIGVLATLFLGSLVACIFGPFVKDKDGYVPFAPFLSIGAFLTILGVGKWIWSLSCKLYGF